jgi:hypothetical protein
MRFLSAFANLRRAAISFVMSVRPSAWNITTPTGRIFMKFHIRVFFFRKSTEKIQVSLKADKNNGHFARTIMYSYDHISVSSSYNEKCFIWKLYDFLFRKSHRLCDNVEKYCTAREATDDNMSHAHCMLDTQPKYVIFTAFPLQQWLHERASLLRYRYNACLVLLWYRKVKVTDAYTFYVIRTVLTIANHHFATQTFDLGCRISFLEVRENQNVLTRTKRSPALSLSVYKRHLDVSH